MGRPKVPDSARRRAAVACTQCRTHKKKCSATQPCGQCVRRGLAASCVFAAAAAASGQSALEMKSARRPSPSPLPTPSVLLSPSMSPTQSSAASGGGSRNNGDGVEDLQPGPRPRLLFNRRGEQVYIGQAASLSFLQLAREIVATRIGPSAFSHNRQVQTMLETASPDEEGGSSAEDATLVAGAATALAAAASLPPAVTLDVEQMLSYARICNKAMDGFMDLFGPSEIESLLAGAHAADVRFRNPYKQATAYLVVAVGAQCASPASAIDVGAPFFRYAQHLAIASEAALEDPSADMVRAFLLMAFYMLGRCRRNAAFMYLGVAARAAVVLGLHSPDAYGDMAVPRFRLRLRIWLSLCNLDMAVAAILGRPAATAGLRAALDRDRRVMPCPPGHQCSSNRNCAESNADSSGAKPGNNPDLSVLMASYSVLRICSDIVVHLYSRPSVPSALVEQYLEAIAAWKRRYGRYLPDLDEPNSIGRIHVACLYYFAVTLATRPVLIRTMSRQALVHVRPAWSQMAQACVEAAVSLVQTCVDGHEAGLFLGNMCMLKAFLFAAGLIVGLRSFTQQHQIDPDVEVAFVGACHSLEWLAVQSPQAAHYLEILRLLRTAIKKQRQRLYDQARKKSSRYVNRPYTAGQLEPTCCFSTDTAVSEPTPEPPPPPPPLQSSLPQSQRGAPPEPASSSHITAEQTAPGSDWLSPLDGSVGTSAPQVWPPPGHYEDEIQFHWDRLDLSQWDNFLEPLADGTATALIDEEVFC